jgi:DHA1 family bicyclomycin/chloramphenicol resistance-like MFS transporter
MSPPIASRHGMSPTVVVMLLTLLLGIQPITTDLYLPALPTLQRELGAGVGAAQLALSRLIICFSVTPLVVGPSAEPLAANAGARPA